MKLKTEKILSFVIKKSPLIIFLIIVLILFIAGFFYWKYLYTALTFKTETKIENRVNKTTLDKIIKNIDRREEKYLKGLKIEYKNPFQ